MPKMLINGILRDKPVQSEGCFHRLPSSFRSWISSDAEADFPATSGRYHLYLSKACPWCHGVELVLALKGLREAFSITWMDSVMSEDGWVINQSDFDESASVPRDRYLYQVYQRAVPSHTGAITVPVLLDKHSGQIISTESADIMRMIDTAFVDAASPDLYPAEFAAEIDRLAEIIQAPIRNGVYRVGFATTQEAYDEAIHQLYAGLDTVEAVLNTRRFLAGAMPTEVDLKLFPTLLRFDPVYVTHFKIDRNRITDYPALSRYLADFARIPDVVETIDLQHIRAHYFLSHRHINPSGIIPIGPNPGNIIADLTKGAA
ncbi:glutathione S-transferase family protein [Ruegeria lacuscaerulensis]|uniref:glutathione S-transferase family protein n=1 Tax=Ruegeria lacuscaerulensis TaxID=55218 RepID=UPI00147FC6B8|nr:glutathione S-transferase C-terminal domain-containing protein [Ruegeria lacuscaerulensis]